MGSNQQDSAQTDWVSRLCLECGLCCNGVLFADVRLVKGDNVLVLANAGLAVKKTRLGHAFDQPCACLQGLRCSVYESRPARCRGFDCHTLKQAQSGQLSLVTALRRIQDARRAADRVKGLLQASGDRDEHRPLSLRYQAAMSRPIDLSSGEEEAEQRGQLMLAVHDLMDRLHRDFLRTP